VTLSADLRAATATTWDAAVGHRFVDELWAGTVDDAVLARYLTQDHQFLDAFVALLGAAVAAADRPTPRLALARQLGLVAGDEDDYFGRALTRLGVGEDDRRAPVLAGPTRRFTALMDDARRSADYGVVLAVLLVAEWLYLDWASRSGPAPDDWLHREWIDLHRGEAFTVWVALLRAEFDRVAADASPERVDRMVAAFTDAVDVELAFFEAAYA
jgi:thiaminase (transcriptional activator TenA)